MTLVKEDVADPKRAPRNILGSPRTDTGDVLPAATHFNVRTRPDR